MSLLRADVDRRQVCGSALAAALALSACARRPPRSAVRIADCHAEDLEPAVLRAYSRGMQLAQFEINGRGGVRALGGRPLHIRTLKVASSGGGPFADGDEADLYIGGGGSCAARVVSRYANARGKLFLATLPMRPAAVPASRQPLTFYLRSDVQMLASMLAASVRNTALRRWSIVAADTETGLQAAAEFAQRLQAATSTVEFVSLHFYAEGGVEPVRVNSDIRAGAPEGVFTTLHGEDLRLYLKDSSTAAALAGRTIAHLVRPELSDFAHQWHGVRRRIMTGYDAEDRRHRSHRAFVQAYRDWHGDAPTYASLIGYVAVEVLAALLERVGSLEGTYLAAALEEMAFETGVGPIIMQGATHQSSFGAWVGEADGADPPAPMSWQFHDGLLHMPPHTNQDEFEK